MRPHSITTRTLAGVLVCAIAAPPAATAAQLSLAQFPAGSAWRAPAPNVILTIDNSGSMAFYDDGGSRQDETKPSSRIYALKTALRTLFDANTQVIPDGAIRLGWNSMNGCRAIPASDGGCNSLNAVRVLDATHRANFLSWVGVPGAPANTPNSLHTTGTTPTHHAVIAAGDYLINKTTNVSSPWASVPGSVGEPFLSCRRAYNVLMTDGGWNFELSSTISVARPTTVPNFDGTTSTLPDGTVYDATSPNTRLYRGENTGKNITQNGVTKPVSTLSDLAFYYWATDLTGRGYNQVKTKPQDMPSGTYGTVTLPPYWNPRNDPATWQHMTMYTVGFGDAAEWNTTGSYAAFPVWDIDSNDMFSDKSSLNALVAGTKLWPDPMNNGRVTLTDSSNINDAATTNGEARKVELWHAAINSRGRFIATASNDAMLSAFTSILAEIIKDNSTPITSFASASTSVARSPTTQFTSGYEAANWTGYVRANTLRQDSDGKVTSTPDSTWGTSPRGGGATSPSTTADKLDALTNAQIASRLILTWSDLAGTAGGGKSFEWAADESYLSTAQKNLIKSEGTGTVSDTVGQRRLNFLRGDTTTYTDTTLRSRTSRQGDIVNSTLWYVADPVGNYGFDQYPAFAKTHAERLPMVYVGGNDGMLHGFSGEDGTEKIAYVPKGVIANLADLTRTTYSHRYYVDGSPFSGDAYIEPSAGASKEWRTLLVGTLGAGGKGYFVLDVTKPGSKSAATGTTVPTNFAKSNAASLVVMDKTSVAGATTEDADIGHIMVNPVVEDGNTQKSTQIVRMNNGRWALVSGNGYNSTNERPVLLIQYLDGDRSLLKIVASSTTGASNGLSAPRLVDIDGNGTPDVIYAGDLRGNMWKFDVMSATASEWKVSFGTSSTPLPLYSATYTAPGASTSQAQPITAPPVVRSNERGVVGLMVAFGTGRNLTEADRSDTSVQSIYSVLDNTRYKLVNVSSKQYVAVDTDAVTPAAVGSGVSKLVQQSVNTNSKIAGAAASLGRDFWTVTQKTVTYADGTTKGWYMNLPESGERVLAPLTFYDDSNIIELMSVVPAVGSNLTVESCTAPITEARTYRTLVNIMDGKAPSVQVMDSNGDGAYSLSADGGVSRMAAASAENRVTTKTKQDRIGSDGKTDRLQRLPELPLRPTWRQLQ
ncbi:pilus assembly protein [Pseudorhodoferax sp. Leaf274]|uniref:pilus assembly protein n=1 Tax=Pseudorhodoferax sp. Leaf274 TaxID=1736318 RepID=UPI0007025E54|nr:PilC/PilY family type IV pilus protein [Pseudorhodoferax sp. Leaf274]KQP39983.1 hypothetical protein ASF44_09790 [Pseudorhodoferax sp. Leaf274]